MRNDSITSDLRCTKTADPSPWCISPCDANEIILMSTVLSIVEEQSSSSETRSPVDSENFGASSIFSRIKSDQRHTSITLWCMYSRLCIYIIYRFIYIYIYMCEVSSCYLNFVGFPI